MLSEKIIENLTESFSSVVPKSDKRVNISHLQFVVFIVFHFLGDAKQSSLAGIRRFMMAETNIGSVLNLCIWSFHIASPNSYLFMNKPITMSCI